mgnify:CR=1 FL=1
MTYSELNARANQLAHQLRDLGIGPDSLVGQCVEPSIETLVGIYREGGWPAEAADGAVSGW